MKLIAKEDIRVLTISNNHTLVLSLCLLQFEHKIIPHPDSSVIQCLVSRWLCLGRLCETFGPWGLASRCRARVSHSTVMAWARADCSGGLTNALVFPLLLTLCLPTWCTISPELWVRISPSSRFCWIFCQGNKKINQYIVLSIVWFSKYCI